MSGPFKMKGYTYPGTSPVQQKNGKVKTENHDPRSKEREMGTYDAGTLPEVTVTADKPITRRDVVQTLVSPHTNIKKTRKVVEHYAGKAKGKIKKVKKWLNKPVS